MLCYLCRDLISNYLGITTHHSGSKQGGNITAGEPGAVGSASMELQALVSVPSSALILASHLF